MARGTKYSQAYLNGAQYDFSGRLLINANETGLAQTLSGEKTKSAYKTQEVLLLSGVESQNQRNFAKALAESALKEAQEVSRNASLVRANEVGEIQSTDGVKTRTVTKIYGAGEVQTTVASKSRTVSETSATALLGNTNGSKTSGFFKNAINALVEASKSVRFVIFTKANTDALRQSPSAPRSLSSVKDGVSALIQGTNAYRTFASNKFGFGILVESSNGVFYHLRYTAPFTFTFGTHAPNPFEEYSTTEVFNPPANASYTTKASTEIFQEDGLSSYKDGQ